MKSLRFYQQQMEALRRQREALDQDFAQVLAEGMRDGYNVVDLLDAPKAPRAPAKALPPPPKQLPPPPPKPTEFDL